jgi:hypothetical protein
MKNEDNVENNISYSSTLTVALSNRPQCPQKYIIGPFETPQQLQTHCKFLLNFLYQKYPATTSLTTMIEEINEQLSSEDTAEYSTASNVLYLIPWISLANGQLIKQASLQKPHTNIIAKITNNHELVFFMRQDIDQHNRLETGLICPTDSKFYAMHGFVETLRMMNSHTNLTNLVIAEPEINMEYIYELLCPKHTQATHTNSGFSQMQLPQITNIIDFDETLPLEARPISPLVFRSRHQDDPTTSAFRRTATSTMRQ